MWVEAILAKDDVISLVGDLLPLSIHLGENLDDGHYLELFEPRDVSLVEGRGLRMSCGARIRWPILGVDLPVTVELVTLSLCPSIPEPPNQDELIFKLTIEAIDFAWTPSIIDDRIVEKINHELAKKRALLSWRFGETLSHVFEMPPILRPLDAVALDVGWGQVRVTNEALVIAVSFRSRVLRNGARSELAARRHAPDPPPRARSRALLSTKKTKLAAVAGGAVLGILTAWAVVGSSARAWSYAEGRA